MKVILKIGLTIFFTITFLWLFRALMLNTYPDFTAYYYNPIMTFSGQNPYLGGAYLYTPTTYPPFSFILYKPLSFIPIDVSVKIFTFLSIILLLASVYILFKTVKVKNTNLFLLVSGLAFLLFPAKFTLGMGQINIFVLFFLCLFLYFFNKNVKLSALFLSLSFLVKLFPVLVFPYLLIKKQFRIFFYSIVIIAIFVIGSFIFISPQTNQYFYQTILPSILNSWPSDYYNQSITGIIARSISDEVLRQIFKIIFSLVILLVSFYAIIKNKIKNTNFEIGYLITATLLLNGFSWQHHYVWMVIPLISTLLFLIKKKQNNVYFVLLSLAYCLIAINLKNPEAFPIILRSHVFLGAFIIWVLNSALLLKTSGELLRQHRKKSSQD